MAVNILLKIKNADASIKSSADCISLKFQKDCYTPYTYLNASFRFSSRIASPVEVMLYIDDNLIHHGLIEKFTSKSDSASVIIQVMSKGFTSLLTENHLEPGLKSSVSLNSLMDSFISIPYVTHEDNSDSNNYIFVKDNSSLWDSIAVLCYKLNGSYPYIEGANNVRITPKSNPKTVNLAEDNMLSYGIINDFTKIISDYHMKDIEGNYSAYNLNNPAASAKKIVRHKHFDIDKQFLSNPNQALQYRVDYCMRSNFAYYGEYLGYKGEDLTDTLNIDDVVSAAPIERIEIIGNARGITTKCFTYIDNYG